MKYVANWNNLKNEINGIKQKKKSKKPLKREKHESLEEAEHQILTNTYQTLVSESNNLINSVENIKKTNTYKDLLTNLIKTYDVKMIDSKGEIKPTEFSQAEVSSLSRASQEKINSGTKYFLWIAGILTVISFIPFLVKKSKLGASKLREEQK